MNILNLTEKESQELKKSLMEHGIVFEKKDIRTYESKYFEAVTISNIIIKFFVFFCLGLFVILNLIGILLSIIYNSSNLTNPIETLVGIIIISFIICAIFSNINTNKKKELSTIYVNEDNFIFNYCDRIIDTPHLYYNLPYDSLKKIEFIIHSIRKRQVFGSVEFTFNVFGYEVTHAIRFTNLTEIEHLLENKFPSLLNILIIDGKRKNHHEIIKNKQMPISLLTSLALFIVSMLLIIVPYLFNYYSLALGISSVILIITALIIFLSPFLYTYHLIQGTIISSVFIIMGVCVPLFIIEHSNKSFIDYIIQNNEILLLTIFGIVGVGIYMYIISISIGKLHFIIKKKVK